MISFENDYLEGCHESILERFMKENMKQESGYGFDSYTEKAIAAIKEHFDVPKADITLLTGGTQTNKIVISSILKPYEGVIAADTGHISVMEAGAIEASGNKILTLEGHCGKLEAKLVSDYLESFHNSPYKDHMVFPGMVYISYPTEYGTLYSKQEMIDLYKVCKNYKIPLFVDGARLGYGLQSPECDIDVKEFATLCDIFYIGATKIGALCGEAVVFNNHSRPNHFMTIVKQNGALLAKGRLLGIQFLQLFEENLYFDLSQHAIDMAMKLKQGLLAKDYQFLFDSPTNQQFIIIDNDNYEVIKNQVKIGTWQKYSEDQTVVRVITSWATRSEDVDFLISVF